MVERRIPKKRPSGEETVGRGKPPKATRFKPGQCGNPKGRPKGSKNVTTHIREEMNVRIPVTEEGKRRKITKGQAVAKQLVNKAVAGDPKAAAAIMAQERIQTERGGGGASDDALQRPEDDLTMESILNRIRATIEENRVLDGLHAVPAPQSPDETNTPPAEPDVAESDENEGRHPPEENP